MRTIHWPEFIAHWPIETDEQLYLDLGLFDIPETITCAVRQLARQGIAAVSVHPSCVEAAYAGQIGGVPEIVTR